MREIYLIARREYLAYVGAWGFWLSLLTAPLLLALFAVGPMLAGQAEPVRPITVVASDPADAKAVAESFAARPAEALQKYVVVPAPAQTPRDIAPWLTGQKTVTVDGEARPLFAALFVKRAGEAISIEYWSTNLNDRGAASRAMTVLSERMRAEALAARGLGPADTARIEALTPALAQYDPRGAPGAAVTDRDRAPYIFGMVLSFVLWSAVMGVANMLLTGVIEEKSNKILDSLLTSASPLQILVGKLLGVAAVSFTLFGVWGLIGGGAIGAASQAGVGAELAQAVLNPMLIGAFAIFFLGGYLIYGALFLALGSLCDTLQESQSLLGPVFLVLTLPILFLIPAFQNPNAPLVVAASWFPLFTPFIMMMRAPAGLGPVEFFGPVLLLVATVALVLVGAARVFHAGVVNQASAASLRRRLFARKA